MRKRDLYLGIFSLVVFAAIVAFLNVEYIFCSDDCWFDYAKLGTRPFSVWQILSTVPFTVFRPIVMSLRPVIVGCFPEYVWKMLNIGFTIALPIALVWYADGRSRFWNQLAFAIGLIFLTLFKGESFVWTEGAVSYLWVGVATLLFLVLKRMADLGRLCGTRFCLACAFSLFAGALHEGFSLPILFGLGVDGLLRIRKLNWRQFVLYFCYFVGTVFLCARASGRCTSVGPASVSDAIVTAVKIAASIWSVWILLFAMAISRRSRQIAADNRFLLLVILGSVAMIFLVGHNGERSLWIANLAAICVLVKEFEAVYKLRVAMVATVVLVGVCLVPIARDINSSMSRCIKTCLSRNDEVCVHDRVDVGALGRYFYNCVYTWQKEKIGHNQVFAAFWGKPGDIVALPSRLYSEVYLTNSFFSSANRLPIEGEYYTAPDLNTIVAPIHPGSALSNCRSDVVRVSVKYDFPSSLFDLLKREFIKHRHPSIVNPSNARIVRTTHGKVLLIAKDFASDPYIKSIQIGE